MMRALFYLLCLALPGTSTAFSQDDKVMELGKATFQTCVACHGPDGKGIKAGDLLMAPSLYDSVFVKENHPELLTGIILKGILKEDNKYIQAMLALEAALNDEQIAALIAYVTKEYGGKRRSVKPNQVAKWRKEYTSRTSPWKRSELGEMVKDANAPQLVTDLTYSVYEGNWKKLPDFASLEPVATGKLPKGLVTLKPAEKIKKGFGIVFEGKLKIPLNGPYFFSLSSDDGSALVIDGETVVGNDGIHPVKEARMKEDLQAGEHTFKILYFDGGGKRALAFNVKGPGDFGTVHLSEERAKGKKKEQSYDPILLKPVNEGEAIVHRAFLPDSRPRAIGVGYPDRVNVVWDADTLNLSYVYRGEFMDASPHWNGRGSGSKPVGVDKVITAQGLPFQVLESLDEPWEPFSQTRVKYERDTAAPEKEITINVKHPDYQFRGYRLDQKRFPTFNYDYQDLKVTDHFTPREIDGVTSLVRTISVSGDARENTFFRVADSGTQEGGHGWIDIGNEMLIKIEGAEPVIRKVGKGNETLVPISANSAITISYRWNNPEKK
ncbi:MAG: PA14 domain-containing protein [Verrucomicrobiales bacterium]|nr:PA14 domain-containing protein [Verrucomicrobiales bacterium]